ncbi:6-phosphogluconolactonase [Phytophthora boehmeriae]|uniref:6-phosphogluconolactonase n=1 Tax=Phytophthora boehmeriae TaxID=109152 RepID=A0A8T1WRN9_9STRA|nr:6-phosphogluconolactonase [Phytophthora boehmeriae]
MQIVTRLSPFTYVMRPVHPLLPSTFALLVLFGFFLPIAFAYYASTDIHLPSPSVDHLEHKQLVSVVVAGATGDLAAKYLWVAMFRLAFEAAANSNQVYRFYAGATISLEEGREWQQTFFDDVFAQRVCGDSDGISLVQRRCRTFLEDQFKPSVRYIPLRSEVQYRDLGDILQQQLQSGSSEVGRIVYLAIPPQFFLQSCALVHRYLRPQSLKTAPNPFFRVVVEKPFGRDLESAHELATRLRQIYDDKELYVMDHYAGKPVVQALRRYFQLNAAALHPIWNTQHIQDVHIEMTETATLENRVNYFDSTGIIRDVMLNHLQFLLGVIASPSFDPEVYAESAQSSKVARVLHTAQLRFIKGLKWLQQQSSLFVAQYNEYAAHYQQETGRNHGTSDHFTATAAMVELTNSLEEWKNTSFHIAAAKATAKRLLEVTVTFRNNVFPFDKNQPCIFKVIIQQALNTDTRQSHRIKWSCDVRKVLPYLRLPENWEYLQFSDQRVITPKQPSPHSEDVNQWNLGDERSAYDVLMREVAAGATEHFADLDEVETAWALWTPIVLAAEVRLNLGGDANFHVAIKQPQVVQAYYPAGTSPWKQPYARLKDVGNFPGVKEEL